MEPFLQNLQDIRVRTEQGTSMCPSKHYPLMMFKCGLLYSRIAHFGKTMKFMETIEFLKAENKLTDTFEGHFLSIIYESPQAIEKLGQICDKLMRNKPVNILLQLQKFQEELNDAKKQQYNSNLSASDSYVQQHQQVQPITRTGTLVLEPQNINQNNSVMVEKIDDNSSEKTQKYDEDYFNNQIILNLQSEALAKKLQQQQQKNARNANLDNETMCDICYVGLYEQQFLPLENCEHIFHKNCLSEYFKAEISENRFPLKCPNDKCGGQVKQSDIRQILDKIMHEKYQKHTLKHYADMHGDSISWCPTPNCQYMFFFEKEGEVRFECLECHKEYCLNCRVQWHKDMSCKQYQISNTHSSDDEAFMKFVKGKKFKQCPKCKFWVQKNEGCDHMTCKCKFEFCYKCGGIFMKCECVAKAQEDMQRRRQQIERKRQRKLQLMEKRKKKLEQIPVKPAANSRTRKSKR